MAFPEPTYAAVDGFRIATYVTGPKDGTPLVLIHGWPELAHSWSPVAPLLAEAGYRVVAYDLLGFGRSAAPRELHHYGIANLVAHLEAVMDHHALPRAVMVGHDWGGIVLWHAVRMIEHRARAAISISTPHVGRAPVDPMRIFRKRFGEDHYFLDFDRRPDEIDALFASGPDAFFRMMFRRTPPGTTLTPDMTHIPRRFAEYLSRGAPGGQPTVMSVADLRAYADAYRETGFLPGMNYYRNTTPNWELAEGLSERVRVPSLMISPEDDVFLPPSSTDGMDRTVADLTRVTIPDCGHWAMWEHPDAVAKAMTDWLASRGLQSSHQ